MLGSQEITKVIERGKKAVNSEFVIFYSPNQSKNCRFGIGVSCKLVKGAVQRNRYRRQIKNILANKSFCQGLSSHYDLVIIIRPGFLTAQFPFRQSSLVELLNSILQKKVRLSQSVNKEIIYA